MGMHSFQKSEKISCAQPNRLAEEHSAFYNNMIRNDANVGGCYTLVLHDISGLQNHDISVFQNQNCFYNLFHNLCISCPV